MYYLLVSFGVFLISTLLFKKAAGSLSPAKPNMISYIYYYQVLAMSFIAAVLAILYLDNHYVISRVSDEARLYGWLSVMYMMVAVPVGMLISKRLWLGNKKVGRVLNDYVKSPINTSGFNGDPLKYSIWVFTVISLLACLYTFYSIGYFPFIKVLTAPGDALGMIRISSSRNFQGNVYIRNVLALTLMPLLSYVWGGYYLANNKLSDGLMFFVSFVMAASVLYYNFSKAPLLWYMLGYVFVYFYAFGKVKVSYVLALGGVAFAGLIAMYSVVGISFSEFFSYNTGPVGRIVLGQAAGTYYMFDLFPASQDFIGFASISQYVSSLLGLEHLDRAARVAMVDFNPRGVEAGTAGVMNSLFIAEAWANFGLVGVLISPLWVGFVIGSLYYFFLKKRKSPLWLALFVTFSFGGSFTGGFNDYIYNGGYMILVGLVIAILLTASMFGNFRRIKALNAHHLPPPTPS
jgi:hypothetical protein